MDFRPRKEEEEGIQGKAKFISLPFRCCCEGGTLRGTSFSLRFFFWGGKGRLGNVSNINHGPSPSFGPKLKLLFSNPMFFLENKQCQFFFSLQRFALFQKKILWKRGGIPVFAIRKMSFRLRPTAIRTHICFPHFDYVHPSHSSGSPDQLRLHPLDPPSAKGLRFFLRNLNFEFEFRMGEKP